MNCAEATTLLNAHGDGELDARQNAELGKHVGACPACAARRDELAALRERIRRDVPYYTATAALRARVHTLIGDTPSPPPPAKQRWRWLSAGALGGSMATAFVWLLATAVLDGRQANDLATEVVADHTRATLSSRLIDVASSDRHTVKPWLSSRLDYSPPVEDFAAEGFALVGGRLDHLERQPVATLVYRYREHVIDVFVRPVGRSAAPAALSTVRGFNVVRASGAGMEWIAVSDASAEVVKALVARLTSGEPSR